jgi:hypothetical protein
VAAAVDPQLARLGPDLLGQFAAALAARIQDVPAVRASPDAAALALVAMAERFHFYVASGQVRADRDEIVDLLTAVAYGALFG